MYNKKIEIFNQYIAVADFNKYARLLPRNTFLTRVEEVFHTTDLKPTYGSVRTPNELLTTVPVFDTKAMILSILHGAVLMQPDNLAEGIDIFIGTVDAQCHHNSLYGEIHTGNAWKPAVQCFCGSEGKYTPFGMVVFGDKSHTDLHGSLSCTPITFTASFFNRTTRNNHSPSPMCEYMKVSEFCQAMRLVEFNSKNGMKMLKTFLQHCIKNALNQTRLPL
jgi:hypothetical protein